MAYKCRICGFNDVEHSGDVCGLCAIGQEPYAAAIQGEGYGSGNTAQGMVQNVGQAAASTYMPGRGKHRKILIGGAASIPSEDLYGNSASGQSGPGDSAQIYQSGQVSAQAADSQTLTINANRGSPGNSASANGNAPLTVGITKNITVDTQKKTVLRKLSRTLFQGIPYTPDDEITMFQVFPDYSGTSLNAMGNACDQVIVYGKLNAGAVANDNEVEVYGHRDSDNNVVAKKIVNRASGTTVTPDRVIPVPVIWAVAIIVFAFLAGVIGTYGATGIVWAFLLILCLTNMPLLFKIFAVIIGVLFFMLRKM